MNIELSEEAVEYGRTALRAVESAGGDRLVQLAEAEPSRREELVAPVLADLGAWDLEPRSSADEAEAAAALCRSAGYWGLAYPVAERLSRGSDGDGLVVISATRPVAALAETSLRWMAVTLEGSRGHAKPAPSTRSPRYSAFVTELVVEAIDQGGRDEVALGLVLPCWTLLGMMDRALQLTCDYVRARHQFGQALASFQGVQFQLTDAEVERLGLEQLAKYALWAATERPAQAVADALALRVAAIEAADTVFRVAHQLHGAIGFCDETIVSWLSRYSQPLRRLPWSLSVTQRHLTGVAGRRGLVGLFDGQADVLLTGGQQASVPRT